MLSRVYFALLVGIRYFRRGRRDGFMSLVSWISLLGMMLGVMSLIVVMSVMNGFEAELRGRVLSLVPHVHVEAKGEGLDAWQTLRQSIDSDASLSGIEASAPYIGGDVLLMHQGRIRGVQAFGVDPKLEPSVSDIRSRVVAGQWLGDEAGQYELLLGDILARQLGVYIGSEVTLVLPRVTVTPMGLFPREKQFVVAGVFQAGSQLDSSTAYLQLADAQKLWQMPGKVQGLRLRLDDLFAAPKLASELNQAWQDKPLQAVPWSDSQGSLFDAVTMEKRMIRVLLLFIVLIAAFNIISILTMSVSEKRSAIAVMRSMGATPSQILLIFIVFGCLTGFIGIGLGVLFGVPLALYAGTIISAVEALFGGQVFDPDVYFISAIPSDLQWAEVLSVSLIAAVLSLLATLYPAWRASQIAPADALRYE